jgi:peroxiredoxin
LPRGGAVDRLVSQVVLLDASAGVRVLLSGDKRRSAAAAIDDLPAVSPPAPPARVAKGRLDVALLGAPEATSAVTLIDAASGKPVASATVKAPDTHAVFDVAARAGRVLYAESTARGERIRSHPFQVTAGGTAVALYALPRLLLQLEVLAESYDPVLRARINLHVRNHTWLPQRATELPLPRGFKDPDLAVADADFVTLTATGLQPSRPIPPGGRELRVAFSLPAVNDKVRWDLDLPYGVFDGRMHITREDGMTVDVPAGAALTTRDDAFVIDGIRIYPKQAMVMTIGMPKLSPAEKALARACAAMWPDRKTPLRDRPAPGLIAPQLDGKPLRLASLRGKLVVVYFTGTWNPASRTELPTFQKAAAAIPDLVVVLVASNAKADDVRAMIGPTPPASLRAVLDPPLDPDADPIGPITRSWKVPLIPESFVIDRGGTVRLYVPNTRDWGTPEAIACLKAVK